MRLCLTDTLPAAEPFAAPPLQQSRTYARVLGHLGARVRSVEIVSPTGDVGHAFLYSRTTLGVGWSLLPRGPLWHDTPERLVAAAALRRLARHCGLLIATPDDPKGAVGLVPLVTGQTMVSLDLDPPVAMLRAGLHPKWRRALERGQDGRLSIAVRVATERSAASLLSLEASQRASRRYRAHSRRFTDAWLGSAAGDARLLTASHGGETIAEMLFLVHGQAATYHLAWTSPLGRTTEAHRVLFWRAVATLRDEGITRIDLGPIDTEATPGLARFKLGTGARAHPLGPTCLVVPAIRQRS